jgi:4-hydroxy-tetrahydrodipicolinate reductase
MTASPLQFAILGVSGRMGRALVAAFDEIPGAVLSGASVSAGSQWIGQDAGQAAAMTGKPRNVLVTADPAAAVKGATVAIDFTLPQATPANLRACVAAGCPLVIGTTGHDDATWAEIERAAHEIPLLVAANMSLGVNLLLKLAEVAAQALDAGYDIEIFEAHHRNKKDAPSGTALALGSAVARGREVNLADAAEFARHGQTGARRPGAIGFSVFRGGDVIGDHTVTFAGIGERIELTHRASDRATFARGALRAAQWIVGRAPGLYSMQDVLGL